MSTETDFDTTISMRCIDFEIDPTTEPASKNLKHSYGVHVTFGEKQHANHEGKSCNCKALSDRTLFYNMSEAFYYTKAGVCVVEYYIENSKDEDDYDFYESIIDPETKTFSLINKLLEDKHDENCCSPPEYDEDEMDCTIADIIFDCNRKRLREIESSIDENTLTPKEFIDDWFEHVAKNFELYIE